MGSGCRGRLNADIRACAALERHLRTCAQEDGDEHRRVILDGLPAGSSLAGLSILCHDEAGRPAGACKGRLTMSWVNGVKKVALKEGVAVDLPALPVRTSQRRPSVM